MLGPMGTRSHPRVAGSLAALATAGVALGRTAAIPWRRWRRGPLRPDWGLRHEIAVTVMRAALGRYERMGAPALRALQDATAPRSPVVRRVTFEPVSAGGVEAVWCAPSGLASRETAGRTLVYLHGGGYVIGSWRSHRDLIARLADGLGARVLAVDYPLSPEHPFPAAQEGCLAATRWALAQGADPERLALAGDSAGGALVMATLMALRDAVGPLPAAAVLFCPWVDPLAEGGSLAENADCDFGDRALLLRWIRDHVGAGDPRDPRVAPLHAELADLPPLQVQVGGAEILRDQALAFAERARKAGVAVDLRLYPGMFHDFQLLASRIPEGRSAVDDAVAFLDGAL